MRITISTSALVGIALAAICTLGLAACGQPTTGTALSGTQTIPPSKQTAIAETTATAEAMPTATSQPTSPPCASSQLAARVGVGGLGAGNELGSVSIRDVSSSACGLQGAVTLVALDAHGQPIPAIKMSQPTTLAYVSLPPNTPATPPSGSDGAGDYVVLGLMGAYRDDPSASNGLCSQANEVVPAQFMVTIGSVSIKAPNYDADSRSLKSMEGCHGQIAGVNIGLSQ